MLKINKPKVFGIGLSKTATTSLNEALCILGWKSIHYPEDVTTYNELLLSKYKLSIMESYDALTDITASVCFMELDKTFPESKFIVTIRDKETWLKSMEVLLCQTMLRGKWHKALLDPREIPRGRLQTFKTYFLLHSMMYKCLAFSNERLSHAFDIHYTSVFNYFKNRNNLLVLDIFNGDGWEKLTKFLDVPMPDVPFPHRNKKVTK